MTTIVTPVLKLQPSNTTINDFDEKSYYWNTLLKYYKLPAKFQHFPGPNPVSLEKQNFQRLQEHDFLAALKTDGIRYLLMLTTKPNSTEPISLMIDRVKNMYEIEIWANEEFFFNGCLLDGELVWSNNNDLQFVIFDLITLKGIDCINKTYRDRLNIISSHVLCMDDTLNDDAVEQIVSEEDKFCARNNSFNLQIFPKMCVPKTRICELWKGGRSNCSHRNDGLILTLNESPVHTGTSQYIYKWKPSHSIDVKCYFQNKKWSFFGNSNDSDDEIDISMQIGELKTQVNLDSKLLHMLENKHCVVLECLVTILDDEVILNPERERSDKKAANTMKTILATIKNAVENIQIEELYQVTKSYIYDCSEKNDEMEIDTDLPK